MLVAHSREFMLVLSLNRGQHTFVMLLFDSALLGHLSLFHLRNGDSRATFILFNALTCRHVLLREVLLMFCCRSVALVSSNGCVFDRGRVNKLRH